MSAKERKRVAVATLGCKLNHYDSQVILEAFEAAGYDAVPFSDPADVYVINTCTVTETTDHQSRQLIRRALRRKAEGGGVRVVVTGCYAQTAPDEIENAAEGVDLIVGNNGKERIAEFVADGAGPRTRVSDVFAERKLRSLPLARFGGYTRAFLRIQEGCDRRCAYCVVPYGRGVSRSETPGKVLEQARRFAAAGYGEIVLTGVHIGLYGLDLDPKTTLAELLYSLHEIEGLRRVRLSSIDPTELSPALIEAVTTLPKVCRHIHVSLQSGDDAVLRRMGRSYTTEEFRSLADSIFRRAPDAALGVDLMTGFPGEDDASFERTRSFAESLPLAYMHVFRFSPRRGTPAAEMRPRVPEEAKKERSRILADVRREKNLAFRRRFIGTELEVLVENRRWKGDGRLTGLSGSYIRAFFNGGDDLFGKFARFVPERVSGCGVEGRAWLTS
ncbi:MAG: tRNA (N(6)-L-threonylcarbamoyladenosine(37)-C(2))-methylthiotransferase MtaB [bacterium]